MELISVLLFIGAFVISLYVGLAASAVSVFIGAIAFGRQKMPRIFRTTWLVQLVFGIALALVWWLTTSPYGVWGSLCGSCLGLYVFSTRSRSNGRY